jgi:hypothetical protein
MKPGVRAWVTKHTMKSRNSVSTNPCLPMDKLRTRMQTLRHTTTPPSPAADAAARETPTTNILTHRARVILSAMTTRRV